MQGVVADRALSGIGRLLLARELSAPALLDARSQFGKIVLHFSFVEVELPGLPLHIK